MPDLSHAACAQYWSNYVDPMIYRVLVFMESVEDWTLDGSPELERAIDQLGIELDDIGAIDMGMFGQEQQFIRLMAHIKSCRGLRLLQALDTAHPGSASKVLIYAEENSAGSHDAAGFFLKRNIVFERLRLLSRIFSSQRLALVARSLEGEE